MSDDFSKPVLIKIIGSSKDRRRIGLFRCHCGNEFSTKCHFVKRGLTKSCGCYSKKFPHGLKHGLRRSAEYAAWADMKQRCYNKKTKGYKYYGAKGIKVSEEWKLFVNFFADMGNRPSDKHSLDRIDVHGDYSKENCRWATREVQDSNKRSSINITIDGETKILARWLEIFRVDFKSYKKRVIKGMSPKDAILDAKRNKKCLPLP